MPKTIILSLGGSLIVPDNIDVNFLKYFKKIIEKCIKKGFRFVIICGGGKIAREMQKAASKIAKLNDEDLDRIGIHATRLNAQLINTIFKGSAETFIIQNPNEKINFKKNIVVAAGWKPGCSTDYDAVLLAKNIGIKQIINMSNVNYIYDKDPRKHKDAKKIEKISWKNYNKLINQNWKAGLNVPFDPIASKEAQKTKMNVCLIGKDLNNFENLLNNKKFKGTKIE